MTTVASQITSLMVVYSIVYSGADQRKHQSSASLAFVQGNSPGPVNSPHKGPVTRKMLPFDDVIMILGGSPGPSRTKLSRIAIGIEHYLRTQTISLWHDLTKQRSSLWNVWITYVNIVELWGKWQLESVRIMGNGSTKCPNKHQNYLEVKIKIKHHRILR